MWLLYSSWISVKSRYSNTGKAYCSSISAYWFCSRFPLTQYSRFFVKTYSPPIFHRVASRLSETADVGMLIMSVIRGPNPLLVIHTSLNCHLVRNHHGSVLVQIRVCCLCKLVNGNTSAAIWPCRPFSLSRFFTVSKWQLTPDLPYSYRRLEWIMMGSSNKANIFLSCSQ